MKPDAKPLVVIVVVPCIPIVFHTSILYASAYRWYSGDMKYKLVRLYEKTWKRLKILAAKKGITLVQLLDELSRE